MFINACARWFDGSMARLSTHNSYKNRLERDIMYHLIVEFCSFYIIYMTIIICILMHSVNTIKLSYTYHQHHHHNKVTDDTQQQDFYNSLDEYDPLRVNINMSNSSDNDGDNDGDGDDDDEPETKPHLFQGDIAIDPFTYVSLRLGVNPMKNPKRLWPNATIPYEISSLYTSHEKKFILRVLQTLNTLTCIKFIPNQDWEDDYVLIMPPDEDGPKGCWSYVGKKGGEQIVALQQPDEKSQHCFSSEGRIMHELMHAIGIYHEQSRYDRDNYIKVHWENIVPKFRKNFKLISKTKGKYSYRYDYNSVMHYGEYYFSKKKGKKPTLTPLQPGVRIGQRKTLSKTDCLKINDLYDCLKGRQANMYKSFCYLLGY